MFFFFFFQNSFNTLCSIFINIIVALSDYNSISFTVSRELKFFIFPTALATFAKNSFQVKIVN